MFVLCFFFLFVVCFCFCFFVLCCFHVIVRFMLSVCVVSSAPICMVRFHLQMRGRMRFHLQMRIFGSGKHQNRIFGSESEKKKNGDQNQYPIELHPDLIKVTITSTTRTLRCGGRPPMSVPFCMLSVQSGGCCSRSFISIIFS